MNRSIVRQYVLENYLFTDDDSELNDEESFLDKGIIDSTGVLEVVFFLEDKFGIKVNDEEILPENLDTVNNIVSFLDHKNSNS